MNQKNEKKILWYSLAFMAFGGVWGFGNVINGFSEYNGLQAIVAWIIVFGIYFVPYALMVGELGSAFKNANGGVSSWISATMGKRLAYYAGWTLGSAYALHFTETELSGYCNKLDHIPGQQSK